MHETADKRTAEAARLYFHTDRPRYRKALREIKDEFAASLAANYLSIDLIPAQRQAIFDKAWERGHANGFREVEVEYSDLVEFVELLIKPLSAERDALARQVGNAEMGADL